MSEWELLARGPDRQILGVLDGWRFTLDLRLNSVGSWSLTIPLEKTPVGWPEPKCGVVFLRDGEVVASGNWDENNPAYSTDPESENAAPGRFTLTGDTDLGRIAYRSIYPSPLAAWGSQNVDTHWRYPFTSGVAVASEVIRVTVNYQVGSLAPTTRREPGIRLGTDIPAGSDTFILERFTELLEGLRKTALTGGGLVFDCLDALDGDHMDFTVKAPSDLTAVAVFGEELGNVAEFTPRRIAPKANVALVAGQGQGTARNMLEVADSTSIATWGRREIFVDQRQTSDSAELLKAGQEALAENGEQFAVAATVVDTDTMRWGRDFNLGDKVSVKTPWLVLPDLVREVHIEVDEQGNESISSVIGTTDATTTDPHAKRLRDLDKRLKQIEHAQ